MSDDYDDQDEPGGLWDPDAFNPPPAPERPALHIVTTQGTADALVRPADATGDFKATDDHTLVRLEQFRPASDTTHWRPRSQTKAAVARRAAAAGILALAVAATAIGYILLSPADRPSRHAPTQRLDAHLDADSERTAATRKVASTSSAVHHGRQPPRLAPGVTARALATQQRALRSTQPPPRNTRRLLRHRARQPRAPPRSSDRQHPPPAPRRPPQALRRSSASRADRALSVRRPARIVACTTRKQKRNKRRSTCGVDAGHRSLGTWRDPRQRHAAHFTGTEA